MPTGELPYYRQAWDRYAEEHQDATFVRHRETVDHVIERIRADGPLSSLDFERRATIDWYWGPTSEVRAVLEALSEAGVISLARRDGNRRYYDLTERLYPPELLAIRPEPREQLRHKLLSRYRANGLLGDGGQSELWHGVAKARANKSDAPGTLTRADLRDELLASGALLPVAVDGVRSIRYIVGAEAPLLQEAIEETENDVDLAGPSAAFLAPLDPFVWGPRPAAPAVRLRLCLGGLRARGKAALGLLRLAAPVRRPASGTHRTAHRS